MNCSSYCFFLMIRRPPRSTLTEHSFPTRRSSDLPMFGVGLLEGVPADSIIAGADPSDDDGDGISGRAHLLAELEPGGRAGDDGPVLGRFGWKAAVRSVHEQNATAFVKIGRAHV